MRELRTQLIEVNSEPDGGFSAEEKRHLQEGGRVFFVIESKEGFLPCFRHTKNGNQISVSFSHDSEGKLIWRSFNEAMGLAVNMASLSDDEPIVRDKAKWYKRINNL